MRRKHIFGVVILALLLAAALCAPAGAFSSEPAGWASGQIEHLTEAGLLDWRLYTASKAPTDAINRGDFCQMLVNLVQMEGDWEKTGQVDPVADGYFTDETGVDSNYGMYYGAAYGITEGSSKNGRRVADANSKLTREQAAKMMCAAIDALETYGGVPAPREGAGKSYADQGQISSWAVDSVARASATGILQGDSSGRFNPKGTLTWQEACVMVDRLYTSAETAVKAKRAEQGIHMMDTAFEMDADKYLNQSANRLYALENNGKQSVLSISNGSDRGVRLETYNADGSSAGIRTIPWELDTCGAFCETGDAYYLAFGQNNMEENGSKTVYRIVKYDRSWNRLGAADISNCYTTAPFDFSRHSALVEDNGTLILHTSRQRYLTPKDGLRHQSNFTAKVRTSDMAVIYQSDTFDKVNYTSHSFAQYVAFDGGLPVYADHGDAYPRGFNLSVESAQGGKRQQNFFPFSGATGDNTTNAVPGGLGVSGSSYLFAGASSPQKGGDSLKKANAFLAVIPKSGGQAQIKWLTSLPSDGSAFVNDVKLVEVNNNTFVVLWQVTHPGKHFYKFDELQYAVFDGQGNQVGTTRSLPGYVAPSTAEDPSVYGSRIVWAKAELDVSDSYSSRKNRYIQIFELDINANSATAETRPSGDAKDPDKTEKPDDTKISARPDAKYPTAECEVNGLRITRTDVADGGQTAYYREDWDGNWLEVSLSGNTLQFTGCVKDPHTSAVLAVGSARAEGFITSGVPFSLTAQPQSADFAGKAVSAGTRGDGEMAYTTFRSGVGLKAALDGQGNPTLQISLPSWLKGNSAPGQTQTPGQTGTETPKTTEKLPYFPETLAVEVGEQHNMFAYLMGSSGSVRIVSSNPEIAGIENGTYLCGYAPGTAVVTATVTLGEKVASGKCTVTVTGQSQAPQQPETPDTPADPGQTGEVEYVKGVICTKLPADGVVTSYREEYNGTWMQIDVVNGSTVRFTGMMPDDFGGRYNYAVVRAFGVQAETPLRAGSTFTVDAQVNAAGLATMYASGQGPSMLSAMICQNYKPGDSAFAGYGFQSGASVALVSDGSGGIAFRVTRR